MIDPLPSDIFQTGQIINNTYEIEGVLGRGGTGEVYRARNQVTGRVFAIKALNAQFSGNEDYVELMKREEEMRQILHDAVVRYNECGRTDGGHVYLVMDYIAGPSLADAMAERRIDPRELLIVAHRVAEGLVATHSHGIVHRDLSPDNIILRDGDPEKATIIDFGIAKDTAAGARTIVGNEFAGKYEYAAPEQLDGHADARTDIYSLGATLLAAFRGDIPYLGTTPGEIVRRKQSPLDTEGVPEPLKGAIESLSAPRPEDRPQSAQSVVDQIGDLLRPSGARDRSDREQRRDSRRRGRRKDKDGGSSGRWMILALPVVIIAAAAGAWFAGLFEGVFEEPIPVASPYVVTASAPADGAARMTANAPDTATGETLRAAFASAANAAPDAATIEIATGMPSDNWPGSVTEALGWAAMLEDWALTIEDSEMRLSGVAPDSGTRDAIETEIANWSDTSGFSVSTNIAAGPRVLTAAEIREALRGLQSCGPLSLDREGEYRLGAEIRVTGDVASQEDVENITTALHAIGGDRTPRVETEVLNEDLCAIRAVLPPAPTANISIWLADGATGAPSLTGVFHTGDNPIAEIHAPAGLTEGYLWVMVVDNTGKVFHLVPRLSMTEQQLTELGTIDGAVRRIRVLHSIDEVQTDNRLPGVLVNEGDYGKSELVAVLSRTPLFDLRRPRDESVASVAIALEESLAGRTGDIIGVASRIIDARP